MISRSVLNLKIWYREEDSSCSFLLLWDGGNKNIYASQKYPQELKSLHQRWRQQYYQYYQISPTKPAKRSGGLSLVGSGEPGQMLREAQQDFLVAFQRWLSTGEIRRVEQQIRDLLNLTCHNIPSSGIDLYLACNDELVRLPWEIWGKWLTPEGISVNNLRIIRTSMNDAQGFSHIVQKPKLRKTKILAIIGYDPRLPLTEDWKALQSLKAITDVERVRWQPEDDNDTKRNKVLNSIADERGWDILFFAGHSEETANSGGNLQLDNQLSLSISDIEDYLEQAKKTGLQLAIFNSCSGLSIANSLLELGIQVVVMREQIRNDVAQTFLKHFCHHLGKLEDVHHALIATCQHLSSAEKFTFPSADLIPSFFSPPNVVPYQIKPFGWKNKLRQWFPKKREAIAISTVLLLSLMVPVQDWLLDWRHLLQTINRQLITKILPSQNREQIPPILLVEIDQVSINEIIAQGGQPDPIDRGYLAKIVDKITEFEGKVIGIEYLLDRQATQQDKLAESLQKSVETNQNWLILATQSNLDLNPAIFNPKTHLSGNIAFSFWDLQSPQSIICSQTCPFAYLLALVSKLTSQNPLEIKSIPQPDLASKQLLQQQLSTYLQNQPSQFQQSNVLPFGLRSIIDFSLPPQQIYQTISAQEFLAQPLTNRQFRSQIPQQTVIITPGNYDRQYKKDYSAPLAIEYWCYLDKMTTGNNRKCLQQRFTTGQAHAYRAYQFLTSHQVLLISDFWLIGIAIILGKGSYLFWSKQDLKQRQKLLSLSVGYTIIYTISVVQLYTLANLSIPLFFPTLVWFIYTAPIFKRNFHV